MNNIKTLNKYFLNNKNIYLIVEQMNKYFKEEKPKKTIITTKPKKNISDNFFTPSELYDDSLFWCWVIFSEGMSSYIFSENYKFKVKNEKILLLVEKLRKFKDILKQYKIKISDVENNLLYEKTISINSMHAILLVHSNNFIYISDTLYYESTNFYDNKTCIIYKSKDRYSLYTSDTIPDLNKYKSTRLVIDKLNKPIYCMSHYKLSEIKEICKKLGIKYYKFK